jgi:hypothetical protein
MILGGLIMLAEGQSTGGAPQGIEPEPYPESLDLMKYVRTLVRGK